MLVNPQNNPIGSFVRHSFDGLRGASVLGEKWAMPAAGSRPLHIAALTLRLGGAFALEKLDDGGNHFLTLVVPKDMVIGFG